ncbi:hypothetical protein Pint_36271 [Pistacia integerrima]|uniref:Uncharacterized protein n=1 Tax=Pistacia integerrima TaxID=434235 RepID=A0ACC0Y153_9ROSI|nr:hypothetical protein Pint_36271 [Pistacia integerrima]
MKFLSSRTILEGHQFSASSGKCFENFLILNRNTKPHNRTEKLEPVLKLNARSVPSYHAAGRSNGLHCSPAQSMGPRRTNRRERTAPTLHQRVAILQTIHSRSSAGDVAIRLDLISKVHGVEQAENYFNNVQKQFRSLPVYSALLNCYANAKSVEKAEATMQEISDLGLLPVEPLIYNSMLNLYYKTGNYEKFDCLIREMEEKGIGYNKMTFCILLNAYAGASDVEGIDKIVNLMESYPTVLLDWELYATAASGRFSDAKAYEILIRQYATTGQKNEVLRLWEIYKKNFAAYNRGYISIIKSLLKFDDLESAEKIFEEWESQSSIYDFRIPKFLIGFYCRKGLLQKAESLISKEKLKGVKLDWKTWFYMATGYLKINQTLEAVEAMKEALVVCRNKWNPRTDLVGSLKFLKDGVEDIEGFEKFINMLREKDIISEDLQEKWLNNVQNGKLNFDALCKFYGDALIDDAEALSVPEPRG